MKNPNVYKAKFFTLVTTVVGFALIACNAKDRPPADETAAQGIGFHDINSAEIPDPIKKSSLSVFELRVISADSSKSVTLVDVHTDIQAEDLKVKIKNLDSKDYDALDKVVLEKQVERCLTSTDSHLKKQCPIHFDIRKGTGFAMGSDKTLWTSARTVKGYLKSPSKDQPQRVEVFIFDSTGNLALNPFEDRLSLSKKPKATKLTTARNLIYAEDNDYVQISSSKSLGSPLKKAATKPEVGNPVYLVGYPGCTACAAKKPGVDPLDMTDRGAKLNSNGVGLRFTAGQVVDTNETWTEFYKLSEESQSLLNMDSLLFYTADSTPENSGSPILNKDGEVVGIHTGGLTKKEKNVLERRSRGVLL